MSPSRIAPIVVGGALLAAWLAAAATEPRGDGAFAVLPPVTPAASPAMQAPAVAADLAADMERLRQRLAEPPVLRMGARSPFSLAPPPLSPRSDTLDPSPRREAISSSGPPPVTSPTVDLIGIATADTEHGSERTAVLTTRAGEVLLVGSGDPVPGGYRVEAVEATAVTLVDGNGARYRLDLP